MIRLIDSILFVFWALSVIFGILITLFYNMAPVNTAKGQLPFSNALFTVLNELFVAANSN